MDFQCLKSSEKIDADSQPGTAWHTTHPYSKIGVQYLLLLCDSAVWLFIRWMFITSLCLWRHCPIFSIYCHYRNTLGVFNYFPPRILRVYLLLLIIIYRILRFLGFSTSNYLLNSWPYADSIMLVSFMIFSSLPSCSNSIPPY